MANKNSKGLGRGIDALFGDYSELDEIDVTNEMVKVRGQISDLALCIVDPEPEISC